MALKKAIRAEDFPMFAAAVLVGGGGPDELARIVAVAGRLVAHIKAGGIPARQAPLYEKPPEGAPLDWPVSVVFLDDFAEWVTRSGAAITGAKVWAKNIDQAIQWNEQPEPGSNVVTGSPRGRPVIVPDKKTVQAAANEIGWDLYSLNTRMPLNKEITPKLAVKYGAEENTIKDRYKIRLVKEYIKNQNQLKQQK